MEKKYELTDETMEFNGKTLHRIRALRDFGRVKAGELGGWIEDERNLSHSGDAWVSGSALVSDSARVSGSAWVSGYALVSDSAWVSGYAQVSGTAQVSDSARVSGSALVSGSACVSDSARVSGSACVSGYALVSDSARVSGSACVDGTAEVSGSAQVEKMEDYITISPIGSRDDSVTFVKNKDSGISVVCGCFSGTIDQFEEAVMKTHGDNEHGKAYRLAIELAKIRIK